MSKTTKPKAKLRIRLLPARHGSKVPKTAISLRLLALVSDLHKLDRKSPSCIREATYPNLHMPPP